MSKEYIPRPLDACGVELPAGLEEVVELMARNVHETWALGRMKEGWVRGPLDATRKHHPSLVEYDRLSEDEKDYDRNTALSAVRALLCSGFEIVKKK